MTSSIPRCDSSCDTKSRVDRLHLLLKRDMASVWEDRELWFSVNPKKLRLRPGERVIDAYRKVKVLERFGGGFQEYVGSLVLTDLRITWTMDATKWLNIIIGHQCIIDINSGTFTSRLTGTVRELRIRAKFMSATPYLISFIPSDAIFSQLHDTVCAVQSSYNSSKIYRNLMLRSAITSEDDQFRALPKEEIYNVVDGFWNLSSNLGNLGTLYITNIRIVWISNINKHYNGSIPYIRIKKIQEVYTKYGFTMTIRMSKPYSDLVFAFQISPEEKLTTVAKEIRSMVTAAQESPIFGLSVVSRADLQEDQILVKPAVEDTQIDESVKLNFLSLGILEKDNCLKQKPGVPVFSKELGIAVETLPTGFTIEGLWKVL